MKQYQNCTVQMVPSKEYAIQFAEKHDWALSFRQESFHEFNLGSIVKVKSGHAALKGHEAGRVVRETKCYVWVLCLTGEPQKKLKKCLETVVETSKKSSPLATSPDAKEGSPFRLTENHDNSHKSTFSGFPSKKPAFTFGQSKAPSGDAKEGSPFRLTENNALVPSGIPSKKPAFTFGQSKAPSGDAKEEYGFNFQQTSHKSSPADNLSTKLSFGVGQSKGSSVDGTKETSRFNLTKNRDISSKPKSPGFSFVQSNTDAKKGFEFNFDEHLRNVPARTLNRKYFWTEKYVKGPTSVIKRKVAVSYIENEKTSSNVGSRFDVSKLRIYPGGVTPMKKSTVRAPPGFTPKKLNTVAAPPGFTPNKNRSYAAAASLSRVRTGLTPGKLSNVISTAPATGPFSFGLSIQGGNSNASIWGPGPAKDSQNENTKPSFYASPYMYLFGDNAQGNHE